MIKFTITITAIIIIVVVIIMKKSNNNKITNDNKVKYYPVVTNHKRNCFQTWRQHGKKIKRFFTNMKTEP